jgi:pSer/pThr/pTyr-binding forkhead associated (FHA) protein
MRDYIVSQRVITSRIENVRQADAPQSPALALAGKVNLIGFIAAGETNRDYNSFRCEKFHKFSQICIKPFRRKCVVLLPSLQCDLLISRSHCNVTRYLPAFLGGDLS